MRYLKYFESNITKQNPFFLRLDRLYISDELAKLLITPQSGSGYYKKKNEEFFKNSRNEKGYFISNVVVTSISVVYNGNYRMDINIFRGNSYDNESGNFQYYIGGRSGDYEMHGKNMIRATRECNYNLMLKFYPIIGYIKNFYQKLKTETFLDIIKNAILNDNSLIDYGVPDEFLNDKDIDYLISARKYNI